MKKVVVSAIVLAAMAGSASAADLGMYRKAPPMPAYVQPFTWSGFYIGAHGGYGTGDARGRIAGARVGSVDVDGGFGGLQLGYNWQTGGFVLGAEVDAALSDISGSDAFGGVAVGSKMDWFGTARGRVGFAFDRALVYGTGGFAWGHNKVSAAGLAGGVSENHTHTGWTVGGGLEYAFSPNWSAKAEYLYLDLGSHNYFGALAAPGVDVDLKVHTVKFGINYRFGGPGPVMASY
jgi:outer membrane immunogenic protein